jgi:hypothetical protein
MSIEQGLAARLAKPGGKVVQVDGLASIGAAASSDGFAAAIAAAKAADVTVVTLGLAFDSYCDREDKACRSPNSALPSFHRSPSAKVTGLAQKIQVGPRF